jgi:hypothetical protein
MEQIQLAKKVFDSLLRVFQLFKLYQEMSPHRQQAIAKFYSELATFLSQYGLLALEIHKKEVLCLGEVIYEQTGRSGEFTLALYHEGMQWLEFLDGVTLKELEKLLEILDEYSRPSSQTQQDLCTRLWDAQLPNIVFQDADDLDDLIPEVEPNSEKRDFLKEKNIPEICSYLLSLPEDPEYAGIPGETTKIAEELEPDEELELHKMEREEDNLDSLSEIFATLGYVCNHVEEKELLVSILELLRGGIVQALNSLDLETAARMLTALRKFSKLFSHDHWAFELFEQNFLELSKSDTIGILISSIKDTESISSGELKKFLSALHPEALQILIPAALQIWLSGLLKTLKDSIITLAALDVEQLERFPKDSEPELIFIVIETLGKLKDKKRAAEILLSYTSHPSTDVVIYALKNLTGMDTRFPSAVFRLIHHENESVRKIAFEYLGSQKNETAEKLFINYLESNDFKAAEKNLVFQCFEALGNCGSSPAYTFLQGIILNRKWYWKIFGSIKLEAAALGLQALGTEEANQVLSKISFKPVQPAFHKDGKAQ